MHRTYPRLYEKEGVAHSEIISNLDIQIDRNELWNLAEKPKIEKMLEPLENG